jgi:hypothetical protein
MNKKEHLWKPHFSISANVSKNWSVIDMPRESEPLLTPSERGRLLMESARRNAVRDSTHFRQVMNEMGITDNIPLLSRKELQRLYSEAGFDPNANDFAQGIVAMREE